MTHRALRVLVADDEFIISDTLAMILKMQGFEAVSVHSGEDAVTLASTFRPDAAILDVFLGGMTGIAAAQAIRRELPTCRIILFSGQTDISELIAKSSANNDVFTVLAKPVHPNALLEALAGHVPARR